MEKLSAGDLIVVSIDGVKYPATLRSLDSATGTFHCEYTAWGQGGKRTVDPLPVSAIFSFSEAGLGDEHVVGALRRRSLLLHAATSVPEASRLTPTLPRTGRPVWLQPHVNPPPTHNELPGDV